MIDRGMTAQRVGGGCALFLDRDGVINVDRGYVHRIEQIEFVPGIFELARFWCELGRPIVVVTNQSGIGRGLFDERAFAELTRWMCERFAAERAVITRVYHCPYHPEHGLGPYRRDHPWRKPNPGMLLAAAADLHLDLAASVLIGDKASDIVAAAAAGVGLRILLGAAGQLQHLPRELPPCQPVPDLASALARLREAVGE